MRRRVARSRDLVAEGHAPSGPPAAAAAAPSSAWALCCTREIVGWSLELGCRADEAIAVVEHAAAVHEIQEGEVVGGFLCIRLVCPAGS